MGRARARTLKAWVEGHFGPRGRGVARRGEPGEYFTARRHALQERVAWLGGERGWLCVAGRSRVVCANRI